MTTLDILAMGNPSIKCISLDPYRYMDLLLEEQSEHPFTVYDVEGWFSILPPDDKFAIVWYYKNKPAFDSAGLKLFGRALLPGYEVKDRDAPRSWVTVARRALGDYVPPRSGSIKEVYDKLFDFIERKQEKSLISLTCVHPFMDESMTMTPIESEVADFASGVIVD